MLNDVFEMAQLKLTSIKHDNNSFTFWTALFFCESDLNVLAKNFKKVSCEIRHKKQKMNAWPSLIYTTGTSSLMIRQK